MAGEAFTVGGAGALLAGEGAFLAHTVDGVGVGAFGTLFDALVSVVEGEFSCLITAQALVKLRACLASVVALGAHFLTVRVVAKL